MKATLAQLKSLCRAIIEVDDVVEGPSPELERLIRAGSRLSNAVFNFHQQGGHYVTDEELQNLRAGVDAWDAAARDYRALVRKPVKARAKKKATQKRRRK